MANHILECTLVSHTAGSDPSGFLEDVQFPEFWRKMIAPSGISYTEVVVIFSLTDVGFSQARQLVRHHAV